MFEIEAKIFRKLLRDDEISHQMVLDLGSGTDEHLREHAPYYFEEIRQPLINRGNILKNLDIEDGEGIDIVADCRDIPLDDDSVDVILFFNLLEHVLRPHQVIDEIYRVLNQSGVCYASAPGADYPFHPDPIDTHLRLSTLEEWEEFFPSKLWDITLFECGKVYHAGHKKHLLISIVRVEKGS